jgi:hypothetical protein
MPSDIEAIKELVLWARKSGVTLARAKVADIELDILSMTAPAAPLPSEAEAKQGLYAQFGGDLLAAVEAETKAEDVYDEDD